VRYSDTIEGLLPSEMMLLAGLVGDEIGEVSGWNEIKWCLRDGID
jgi:hypothetical protein